MENIIIVTLLIAFRVSDVFSTQHFVTDLEAQEVNILISAFKMNDEAFIISQYAIIPLYALITHFILRKDLSAQINTYQFITVSEFITQAFRPFKSFTGLMNLCFTRLGIHNTSLHNWMLFKTFPVFVVFISAYFTLNNIFIADHIIPYFFKTNAPIVWAIHAIFVVTLLFIASFFITVTINIRQARRSKCGVLI